MSPTVYWPDESLPVAIYFAPGVLAGLELLATDGLLAMPRTGLGIGGLLLGRQSAERLEILKTVAISCSHAMGPSFVLTEEEVAAAKAEDGADPDCSLVGWYCSSPNGRMALTENEEALFDALCGERGQVALLIRPRLGHITMATFAIRGDGQNGDRFRLGTEGELIGPERVADPEPETSADSEPVPVALPELPAEETAEETPATPLLPLPILPPPFLPRGSTLFGVSMDEPPRVVPKKRQWPLYLLLAAILLAILAAAAYLTRSAWMPLLSRRQFATNLTGPKAGFRSNTVLCL
jgi:hypothetical protein